MQLRSLRNKYRATVLLQKNRSYAEIYNDLDGDVVNLFKICRTNGSDLLKLLIQH